MNALDTCNACDQEIKTPNAMGYCDDCLKGAKPMKTQEKAGHIKSKFHVGQILTEAIIGPCPKHKNQITSCGERNILVSSIYWMDEQFGKRCAGDRYIGGGVYVMPAGLARMDDIEKISCKICKAEAPHA